MGCQSLKLIFMYTAFFFEIIGFIIIQLFDLCAKYINNNNLGVAIYVENFACTDENFVI